MVSWPRLTLSQFETGSNALTCSRESVRTPLGPLILDSMKELISLGLRHRSPLISIFPPANFLTNSALRLLHHLRAIYAYSQRKPSLHDARLVHHPRPHPCPLHPSIHTLRASIVIQFYSSCCGEEDHRVHLELDQGNLRYGCWNVFRLHVQLWLSVS